jgi:hypothetical protein
VEGRVITLPFTDVFLTMKDIMNEFAIRGLKNKRRALI